MISFFKKTKQTSPDYHQKLDQEFRKFLAAQIKLPETNWQEEFREYLEQKIKEKNEIERYLQKGKERSEIEAREWEFRRYLKGLDLEIKDIKHKRILDLGCGEGNFVKECLRRGMTDQIYGLDIRLNPKEIEDEYRGHFVKADFERELPLSNLDLIISIGALEAPIEGLQTRRPNLAIQRALEALRSEGEMRIYPIRQAPPGSQLKGVDQSFYQWQQVLENLTKQQIEFELRPIDIRVGGYKPDVWLERVLIIKKGLGFKVRVV